MRNSSHSFVDVKQYIKISIELSLNLSIRQREAEVNKSSINLDGEIGKSKLSFSESDWVKMSKDPYLKESIRLMAQWIERLN